MANAYHYQNSFNCPLSDEFRNILSIPFAPHHFDGLSLWLDANDAKTIIKDEAGKVSKWSDKSGLNNHATQPTSDRQPTSELRNINDKNTIDFDGNEVLGNFMSLPNTIRDAITRLTNHTIFVVFQSDNTTINAGIIGASQSSSDRMGIQFKNDEIVNGYYNGSSYTKISGAFSDINNAHIITINHANDTQPALEIDGESQSGTTQPSLSNDALSTLCCDVNRVSRFFNGAMAEVII